MESTRILIADDHHLVAESLSMLLGTVDGFEIVGTVNNGWQALSFAEKNTVDIVHLQITLKWSILCRT